MYACSNSHESIFAHTFLVIGWNLMCRASNTLNIKYEHMLWKRDSLGIFFAHQKNDSLGEKKRDARHIYANPLNPEICSILAIGI